MVELILAQRERRGQRQPPRQAPTEGEEQEPLIPQDSEGANIAPSGRATDSAQQTGLSSALEAANQSGDEEGELPSARQAALRAVRQLQERRARAAQVGQGAHTGRVDAAQPTGAAAGQRPGRVDFGAAEAARRANEAPLAEPGGTTQATAARPGTPQGLSQQAAHLHGDGLQALAGQVQDARQGAGVLGVPHGASTHPPAVTSRTQGTPEDIMRMLERLQLHDHALERAFDALLSAMEKPEHQRLIVAFAGSDEEPPRPDLAWQRLQAAHARGAGHRLPRGSARRWLTSAWRKGSRWSRYWTRGQEIRGRCEDSGVEVGTKPFCSTILNGLPGPRSSFVQIENKGLDTLTEEALLRSLQGGG